MTYVRHRKRMVAQSVYEDLTASLRATGWLPDPPEVPPLLERSPLVVIDYFPEQGASQRTAMNTLAIDKGVAAPPEPIELGAATMDQEYTFHLAFFAVSDAAADALFQDLHDRYLGMGENGRDYVELFDYSKDPTGLSPVTRMGVESFEWVPGASETASLATQHLHFGRLVLTDYLEWSGP